MSRLLPPSTESLRERQTVGISTVLLHVLCAWWLLQVAGHGVSGAGDAVRGEGDALVVEFVALPSSKAAKRPLFPSTVASTPTGRDLANTKAAAEDSEARIARVLSESGEHAALQPAPHRADPHSLQAASTASATSSAKGGSPADDLLASYHAALRAAVQKKWTDLTDRPFPSDCVLQLTQAIGGVLHASSAAGCNVSQADRLQLEAAALMAQPLPYAGYEAVFSKDLSLDL